MLCSREIWGSKIFGLLITFSQQFNLMLSLWSKEFHCFQVITYYVKGKYELHLQRGNVSIIWCLFHSWSSPAVWLALHIKIQIGRKGWWMEASVNWSGAESPLIKRTLWNSGQEWSGREGVNYTAAVACDWCWLTAAAMMDRASS